MDGLFDTIAGLPMHPLLVHAPVVLLPLGALGLLLVLVRRAWRERYGFLVGAALVAGAGAAFVAAESGEALAKRVGVPADHSTWGDRLPLAAGALAVVALGWLLSTRRSAQSGLAKGLGALAAVLAVAVVALTALVGHSGASAAWKDRIAATPSSTGTAAGTASATASASGTATGSTAYSLAQVAEHATAQSCWAAVDGKVYDLTAWIARHPGGDEQILGLCGIDATAAFHGQHGTAGEPAQELAAFVIGALQAG